MEEEKPVDKAPGGEERSDEVARRILSQLKDAAESEEVKQYREVLERLEKLERAGIARRVYVRRKEYVNGPDLTTAVRTGVEPGESVVRYEPTEIFLLPLDEDEGSHLVVDARKLAVEYYYLRPRRRNYLPEKAIRAHEEEYKRAFSNKNAYVWVDPQYSEGDLIDMSERHALNVGEVQLVVDTQPYTYKNEEELYNSLARAVEVGKRIKMKQIEFARRANTKFLEMTAGLEEEGKGEDESS